MRFSITTVDIAMPGMERLRGHDEFILTAYPSRGETGADVLAELVADLDACEREEGFDYDAAEAALRTYFDRATLEGLTADIAALDLPEEPDGEGPNLYVFVRTTFEPEDLKTAFADADADALRKELGL